jgi:hypothetical protein
MKTFRLTQRCEVYEHCYIEAESAEAALKMFQDDTIDQDYEWKHDEYGDTELIGVDEVSDSGEPISCHEVCDGELLNVDGEGSHET